MKISKNYFTVAELQQICHAIGISTDGSKPEIVERIMDFVSTNASPDVMPNADTDCRSVEPVSISHQHTQTDELPNSYSTFQHNTFMKKFIFVLFIVVLIVGFFGGCISISQLFAAVEDIKIPVKRSWFKFKKNR